MTVHNTMRGDHVLLPQMYLIKQQVHPAAGHRQAASCWAALSLRCHTLPDRAQNAHSSHSEVVKAAELHTYA